MSSSRKQMYGGSQGYKQPPEPTVVPVAQPMTSYASKAIRKIKFVPPNEHYPPLGCVTGLNPFAPNS